MAKKATAGKCVHCLGTFAELTRDHVIPSSWYPDTTPQSTQKWTVPSCRDCNQRHGKNESYLLSRLGLCLDPEQQASAGITDRVLRGMNPGAGESEQDSARRGGRRDVVLKQTMKGASIPREAVFPGFGPYPGLAPEEQVGVTVSADALDQLAEKIVRGVTYFVESEFIDETHDIRHHPMHEPIPEFTQALERFGKVHDLAPGLRVRHASAFEDKASGLHEITLWGQWKLYASVSKKATDK